MRTLWTLTKIVLALAIGVPLAILCLSMVLGVLGALVGLAMLVLRIAIIGLLGYAAVRLVLRMIRGPEARAPTARALPEPVAPYREAATRELDRELGVR